MKTVLITGGTGLIGRQLSKLLSVKGYAVSIFTTSGRSSDGFKCFRWDPSSGTMDAQAVAEADYIIHLAGANIGEKRWSQDRKRAIVDSRVKSGELLFQAFLKNPGRLKAFITASATGYYGAVTSQKIFTEDDAPESDFLGETCRRWEETAGLFEKAGIRTVKIRTGIVLDKTDGALSRLLVPMRLHVGSALGSGSQFMPWIHLNDICGIYLKAIEDVAMKGAYNAVAPQHTTNLEFTAAVAKTSGRTLWFPNVPAFVLKAIFGEMSAIILEGSRVSADKIMKAGFNFEFPELNPALENLLNEKQKA